MMIMDVSELFTSLHTLPEKDIHDFQRIVRPDAAEFPGVGCGIADPAKLPCSQKLGQ